MKFIPTGVFATAEQLKRITAAFDLDYRSPVMAVLPNGELATAPEDFRELARRFAKEAGLPIGDYGIEPGTREFQRIEEQNLGALGSSRKPGAVQSRECPICHTVHDLPLCP